MFRGSRGGGLVRGGKVKKKKARPGPFVLQAGRGGQDFTGSFFGVGWGVILEEN